MRASAISTKYHHNGSRISRTKSITPATRPSHTPYPTTSTQRKDAKEAYRSRQLTGRTKENSSTTFKFDSPNKKAIYELKHEGANVKYTLRYNPKNFLGRSKEKSLPEAPPLRESSNGRSADDFRSKIAGKYKGTEYEDDTEVEDDDEDDDDIEIITQSNVVSSPLPAAESLDSVEDVPIRVPESESIIPNRRPSITELNDLFDRISMDGIVGESTTNPIAMPTSAFQWGYDVSIGFTVDVDGDTEMQDLSDSEPPSLLHSPSSVLSSLPTTPHSQHHDILLEVQSSDPARPCGWQQNEISCAAGVFQINQVMVRNSWRWS